MPTVQQVKKNIPLQKKSGLAAQAYALLGQLNDRWQEEALADYLTFEDITAISSTKRTI